MFLGRGIKPEGLNLHLQEVFREVTTPLAMRVGGGGKYSKDIPIFENKAKWL